MDKIELELRRQAVRFDKEMLWWMSGIRFWMFILIVVQFLSLILWWFAIGGIAVGFWMIYLVVVGMKAKKRNIGLNEKEVEEMEGKR